MARGWSRFEKITKLFADVAICIVAILIVVVVVRNRQFLFRPAAPPKIAVGDRIALDGIDWSRSKRTLVLVASTQCAYCTQSAEFYRRLAVESLRFPESSVVAVFPQPVSEAQKYLDSLGIPIVEVHQGALSQLGVRGTPTILAADSRGVLLRTWKAKLDPERENQVLMSLSP